MSNDETRRARYEIARLETELEKLEAAVERCRKVALASRLAIAVGPVLLILAYWRADPTPLNRVRLSGAAPKPDVHRP